MDAKWGFIRWILNIVAHHTTASATTIVWKFVSHARSQVSSSYSVADEFRHVLVSQNGVKASLDVTEMVFCCIVAWILAWQFRLPARFSVTWRWNRFRIAQNDQNNFILRQTKNRFVWPNETWCFRLVHVLLYDNFVHYLMMMSRKFGMKIYFFNWQTEKKPVLDQ